MSNKKNENAKSDNLGKTEDEKKQTYQIFVGAIHPEMVEETFTSYFSSFGTVAEVRLMKDKITKKFRGFGFVSFEDEESRTAVLAHGDHILMEKKMDVKIAKSREETTRDLKDQCSRKLYVTKITPEITKGVLREFFEKYGEIESIKVKYYTKSGNDFAFILYKLKEGLENALKDGEDREIKGVNVKCERTLLRDDLKKTQMEEGKKRKKVKADKKRKKRQKKKKREGEKGNLHKSSMDESRVESKDSEKKKSKGSNISSQSGSNNNTSHNNDESMVTNPNTSTLTHQNNASFFQNIPPGMVPPQQANPNAPSQVNYANYYPPNRMPPYPHPQQIYPYWNQGNLNNSYQVYPPYQPQNYNPHANYNLAQSFNHQGPSPYQHQAMPNHGGYPYQQPPVQLAQANLATAAFQAQQTQNQRKQNQGFKVVDEHGNFKMENLETKFSTDHLSDIGNETLVSFAPLRGFEPKRIIVDQTQSEKNPLSKSGKSRRGTMSYNSDYLKKIEGKSSSELERERLKAIMDQDYIDDTASVMAQSGKWKYSNKMIKEEDEFVCIDEDDFEDYPELKARPRTQLQEHEKSKAQDEINQGSSRPEDEFLMGFKVVEKEEKKMNDSRYVSQNAEIYSNDEHKLFKSVWKVWDAN